MMNDFKELLVCAAMALVAVTFSISTIIFSIDYLGCLGFEKGTGIETRWSFACYAKVNGEWMPKQYVFGKANEIRIEKKPTK